MKIRLPIRVTILTLFIGLAGLVVTVVSVSNYVHSVHAARNTAVERIRTAQDTTANNVEDLLNEGKLLVRAVSALPSSVALDPSGDELFAYFRSVIREVPWVYSLYVGFGDGRFVQIINLRKLNGGLWDVPGMPTRTEIALRKMAPMSRATPRRQGWLYLDEKKREIPQGRPDPTSQYDPRARPWYTRAMAEKRVGASDIYIFSSLQKAGVTVSAPMLNVPGAVVGFDAPLDVLADFVSQQRPSEHGLVAIYTGDGTMVAHPHAAKIVTPKPGGDGLQTVDVTSVDDPLLVAAHAAAGGEDAGLVTFMYAGAEYLAARHTIMGLPGNAWRLLTIAKVEDFTGPVREGIRISVLYSLVILVLSVAVAAVIANWIARPLIASSDFAHRISKLDLTADAPAASPLVEVQRLTAAMAAMRRALKMFLRYAPRDLVHQLVASGKTAEIGGERRTVTLLFTDIKDFTAMTEHESPEEILMHTSMYFETMTKALSQHRGTIDKFMGDGIMTMWNAPAEDPNHVDHACLGALAARAASEALNDVLAQNNFPKMQTRFGLHTGEALVGNIGSPDRMQFTSLGPVVNLASRIEGLNKHYGTQLLVSGAIESIASGTFVFRMLDLVEAKGTSIPVELYELVGTRDPNSPFHVDKDRLEQIQCYEDAFTLYASREFERAQDLLNELLVRNPNDGAAQMLAERCHHFVTAPPPPNWEGVNIFVTK